MKMNCKKMIILALVIIVSIFSVLLNSFYVQFANAATCGGSETILLSCEEGGSGSVNHIILLVIDIMSIGIGILGVVGIAIFGIQLLTSGGDASKSTKARNRLIEVIIGLVLYAILYGFARWFLPGNMGNVAVTNSISISYQEATTVGQTFSPKVDIQNNSVDKSYSLMSDNPKVASIAGVSVRCESVGTANVTAISTDGKKASMAVNCQEATKPEKSSDSDEDDESDSDKKSPSDDKTSSPDSSSPDGGSADDGSTQDSNKNKNKKKVLIILGASQIARLAESSGANIKSYKSASATYSKSNKSLNFIYKSGSGFDYQYGDGWKRAASIMKSYSNRKDSTEFFIYFTLVGNSIKPLTCDTISNNKQLLASQISKYNSLIAGRKNDGYNVNAYVTSVQPVQPNNKHKSSKVVSDNDANKCSIGYRSNYKYRLYNNAMKPIVAQMKELTYVDTFDQILNGNLGFNNNWKTYKTTDGVHWDKTTAKKYFNFWMGLNPLL